MAGYATVGANMIANMIFIGVAVFALTLILCMVLSPQHTFGLAVVCLMMSGASLVGSAESIGVRIEAVLLLAGLLTFRPPRKDAFQLHSEQSKTLFLFVAALWLTIMAVALPHGDWSMAINASLGVLAVSLMVVVPSRVLTRAEFQNSVTMVLLLFLLSSAVVTFFSPSIGMVNLRLRGLTANANLLGFYILLTITLSLIVEQRKRRIILVLVVAIPSLILTGSRTSAIALAVIIILGTIGRTGYVSRAAGFLLVGLVTFFLSSFGSGTGADTTLLRSGDSRNLSWERAVWVYHYAPLVGVGIRNVDVEVASSPLRAFVGGGAVGLFFLVFAYIVLIVSSWRLGWGSFTLASGALVHSLGEGWLVSLTGPMVLMFVLAWLVITANDTQVAGGEPSREFQRPRKRHRLIRQSLSR